MSNIDKQVLRWKAEKATQGEWWSDSCGNEGTYGSGDDCVEGEALDDTTVHGVVTHFLNRVDNQRPDPIPVM
ncbi:hypothetical protein [Enterobacter hormaechei]|uniref:hypothetical protein n=1 Tax=Enterobacter hormaechei TaxID=158836 RepID=UPI003BB84E6A